MMNRILRSSFAKAVLIGALSSVFYLALLSFFPIFEIQKLKVQDSFFAVRHQWAHPPAVLNDFVLVTVDDESIEKIQEKWPFRRSLYAEFIEKITQAKPRLIAFDLVFSGKGEPLDDLLLVGAIEKSGQVVLASFVDTERNYIPPLKEFVRHAHAGVVNKLLDRDLYVRRATLFYLGERGGVIAWPWEVEILIEILHLSRENQKVDSKSVRFISDGKADFMVPLYDRRGFAVNYRFDLKDVAQVPFWKAIDPRNSADIFNGKIVLVGATSKVAHDYYHTPLGFMPGVVVNMNLLVNLLAKDFLKKVHPILDSVFVFAFIFLASYFAFQHNVLRGLLVLTAASICFLAGFIILFVNRYLGDCFTPLFGGWMSFIGVTFYRSFHTFLENIQLKGKVVTDPLTGLYNRRALESRIEDELEKIARTTGARKTDSFYDLSILMIDIDEFKKVNDTYGHQFGDDVLKNIGFTIKNNTRKDDLVARFGGEEFCVVLPDIGKAEAAQIAEKIRAAVEAKKFSYVNKMASFTVSIGTASAKADHLLGSRGLIRGADQALYTAKRTGKNKVCLHQRENR
ncbi:MAG: hypothetical protein A3C35_03970 [Omnitrophica bacterium RIFCSPHIGHO2_02_FULL_46_11]|nr:MAG: hypothetical protein A3C35_03970 [Omnitrophica bacterium RIFCSPHIGHO2_02_FULL_46_11]